MLVSWEPWTPVPAALGLARRRRHSAACGTSTSRAAAQDRYIMRFARSLARFHGTVWLRYAHEMNGYWYPWSRDARGVPLGVAPDRPAVPRRRRAQRALRVVGQREPLRARAACGSPTPGATGRASATSTTSASTVIDFGGDKDYAVAAVRRRACERSAASSGSRWSWPRRTPTWTRPRRLAARPARHARGHAVGPGRDVVAAAEPRPGAPRGHERQPELGRPARRAGGQPSCGA